MRSYGQFCPIAKAASLFCERWTALVIRSLAAGAERFSDIHRGVPLMSPTLLSTRLKQLEADGIVERHRGGGQHWLYHLTEAGREFVPLLDALGTWGQRWTRRDLVAGEIDLGLLIWGLEHCIDGVAFGKARSVVELCFTDQPAHRARFWFVNGAPRVQLCVSDPGFGTDLCLAATLRDMTHVYRGDISVAAALASGRIDANGPRRMTDRLAAWLNLGPVAEVRHVRVAAEGVRAAPES